MTKKKPKKPIPKVIDYKKLFTAETKRASQLSIQNLSLTENCHELKGEVRRYLEKWQETKQHLSHGSDKKLMGDLVDALSQEEIEASKNCGCRPEVYAVELLKIYQDWKRRSNPISAETNNRFRYN